MVNGDIYQISSKMLGAGRRYNPDMPNVLADIEPQTASPEELAAIAAVLAVVTEPMPVQQPSQSKENAWSLAARLESTMRVSRISDRQALAKSVPAWLTFALLLVSCCLPAHSSESLEVAPLNTVPAAPRRIKVALAIDTTKVEIAVPDGAVLRDVTTGDTLAEFPSQSRWQLFTRAPSGFTQICFAGEPKNHADRVTKLATRSNYSPVAFYSRSLPNLELKPLPDGESAKFWLPMQSANQPDRTYVLVPTAADGTLAVSGRVYRGALLLRPRAKSKNNGMDLINELELEDYLLSVVPSEMPSSWPIEALKAQAITARSYALANAGKHASEGFDVKSTVDDQAYTGVSAENPRSNLAVHETRGLVLTHEGKVISAFFHSASGGHTELSENVWYKPLPYLRAVADYDDESPHFAWTRTTAVDAAEAALAKAGKPIGALLSVTPVARGLSPRVRWLLISGTDGSAFISGEEARRIFGLPSASFNVGTLQDAYVFAGRGYGHGLGMSQWGAKRLAESGYTAEEILSYYFKDVTVNQIYQAGLPQ